MAYQLTNEDGLVDELDMTQALLMFAWINKFCFDNGRLFVKRGYIERPFVEALKQEIQIGLLYGKRVRYLRKLLEALDKTKEILIVSYF